jgi:hypothetical protein
VVLALIGLALPVEFNVIGRLTLSDALCAALVPFLLVSRWREVAGRQSRAILILGCLWLFSSVITDFIRNTPSEDFARGWAKISFLLIDLISLQCIIRNRLGHAVSFVFFCSLGSALKLSLGIGGIEFGGDVLGIAWKFGYGILFAEICFLIAIYARRTGIAQTVSNVIPFIASGFALVTNSRNLFAITVLSSLINIFRQPGHKISYYKLAIYIFCGCVAGYGIVGVYKYAASDGILGSAAQAKYEAQAANSLGLIVGRGEFFSSTRAIADSPILGHGSWAKDTRYIDFMIARLEDAGVVIQGDPYASGLIPTHSHLFGAWVEAGLMGGIFWMYVLYLIVLSLLRVNKSPSYFTAFVSLICLQFAWDIFFSPFGLDQRLIDAGWLCLLFAVLAKTAYPDTFSRYNGGSAPRIAAPDRLTRV